MNFFIKQLAERYKSSHRPNGNSEHIGIAVDLGTTHICVAVCDLYSGTRLASYSVKNPQAALSPEIISRLVTASNDAKKAKWLRDTALQAIAEIVKTISDKFEIAKIKKLSFVGNTAMLSILVQANFEQLINPQTWALKATCNIDDQAETANLIGLSRDCEISIIQPLGGFVGSDLLAGLVSERINERQKTALLVDFGTNSEIALWDKNRFWATSAAGGPAFEGGGISCGVPAVSGAIYKITPTQNNSYEYHTIENTEALGLCGSGLVDALAIFLESGVISKNGRIKDGSRKIELPQSRFFLSSGDIDMLQRAKAAIGAGIETLCHDAGVLIENIDEYYICGAFGKYIDTKHATAIGLLPNMSHKTVKICGNSALNGCQDMLVSQEALDASEKIRGLLTVTNLGTNEFFEDSFFRHLFF